MNNDKHILDDSMFENLKQMILSNVDDNIILALGIIKNIKRTKDTNDKYSQLIEMFWQLDTMKIHKFLQTHLKVTNE